MQRVQKADASTDARDILEHAASIRKANMILQCCPLVMVDDGGMTPPDEDPTLYYLVIKNLRDSKAATRELVHLLVQQTANYACMEFAQVHEHNYSAYIVFRTIRHILAVAKAMPKTIAHRDIITSLAESKYILSPEKMLDLMKLWTHKGQNGAPLHCVDD